MQVGDNDPHRIVNNQIGGDLTYIDDEAYRRRILQQINRGEGRHSVARAVFFGKRGELRRRYKEGQED